MTFMRICMKLYCFASGGILKTTWKNPDLTMPLKQDIFH